MLRGWKGSHISFISHISTAFAETGNNFIVYVGGGKKVGQFFQLRAHSEKERQEWVTALELAKVCVCVCVCVCVSAHCLYVCVLVRISVSSLCLYPHMCMGICSHMHTSKYIYR